MRGEMIMSKLIIECLNETHSMRWRSDVDIQGNALTARNLVFGQISLTYQWVEPQVSGYK